MEPRKPTPEQRKKALVTGVVLAAMAVAIYLVLILKFVARG